MSQLNFFMTKDELVNEINQLLNSEDYLLFDKTFFDSESPETVSKITNIESLDRIVIWIKNDKLVPTCSAKGAGQFEGKFLFDVYKDPIIELDIGKKKMRLFSPNRLFYKAGWIDDKELRELHIKSATKLVRTFKKKLITTSRIKPFYITESVANHLTNGYELELGEGGMRVTKHNINGT
jgi:hypothetical protein